jgi:hypothetical protein
MKRTQLFLLWLFYFASFCAQNTSQGAAITTKSTDGPQGRRELRTTACTLILARAITQRKMQTAHTLNPEI